MSIFNFYKAILLSFALIPSMIYADASITVRPQTGYGYINASGSESSGQLSHAGIRVLLKASEIRKYGLEASRLKLKNGKSFTSLGIILEQKRWTWFNISIGTVGYFNYGENSENPIGLITNLGWEPSHYETFKPFITFRSDIIFSNDTDTARSLSAGMSLEF